MPRRTIQDALADLADIGIECGFVQDGPRHRHGYYEIRDWGDHDPRWVADNLQRIIGELDLPGVAPPRSEASPGSDG